MAQNVYDRPDFFAGYAALERSRRGLEGAPEWPALRAMLPHLEGASVVDLGCGYGWFCRWARQQGARRILGLDLSARMLARARQFCAGEDILYARADLARPPLPEAAFDLAYSSLALHYVEDARALFASTHRALVPGGRFVFSTEHPAFMAPSRQGWTRDGDGHRIWPLDNYFAEGPRRTDWLSEGVVKHHRTIGTTLNGLIAAGFGLAHVEEFCPTPAQIAARPELAEERERPMFLLVAARKASEP